MPAFEHQVELARKFFPAQPPIAGGARHQIALQELLIILQVGRDRRGGVLELVELRRVAGELKNIRFVKGNRAAVLQDGRFQDRFGRMRQCLARHGDHARDLRHALQRNARCWFPSAAWIAGES